MWLVNALFSVGFLLEGVAGVLRFSLRFVSLIVVVEEVGFNAYQWRRFRGLVLVFAVDENAGVSRRYLCTCFQYIV